MQSRYYNPEWGRFINADGIAANTGELLSANMFAYCENNPVNTSDPSGRWGLLTSIEQAFVTIVAVYVAVVTVCVIIKEAVKSVVNEATDIWNTNQLIKKANSNSNSSSRSRYNKSNKNKKRNSGKNNLSSQQLNQYKSKVLEGKDVHFSSKQQAVDFIQKKFPDLNEEVAGSRSSEGWHFDSHPINGSSDSIEHINIYSKSEGFRIHVTWDVK